MDKIKETLFNYLPFIIIFSLILVGLFITILYFTKNKSKNIYLIGYLLDLNNKEILSLTLILINFLFVVYTLIMKIPFNIYNSLIPVVLIIIAFLILDSFKNLFINVILNGISVGILYLGDLVNTLRIENNQTIFYIFQIVLNVFGILYLSFITCKYLYNIKRKDVKNG